MQSWRRNNTVGSLKLYSWIILKMIYKIIEIRDKALKDVRLDCHAAMSQRWTKKSSFSLQNNSIIILTMRPTGAGVEGPWAEFRLWGKWHSKSGFLLRWAVAFSTRKPALFPHFLPCKGELTDKSGGMPGALPFSCGGQTNSFVDTENYPSNNAWLLYTWREMTAEQTGAKILAQYVK